MAGAGKYLIIAGVVIALIGLVLWLAGDKLSWLGNLPGDIKVEKPGFKFYMPVTTMILLSILISLILWLARRL